MLHGNIELKDREIERTRPTSWSQLLNVSTLNQKKPGGKIAFSSRVDVRVGDSERIFGTVHEELGLSASFSSLLFSLLLFS
jgi:hypothetical protein